MPTLQYDFREKPNPTGDKDPQPLFPRVVGRGTINSKQFVAKIAKRTTFSEGEVKGILGLLSDEMAECLNNGFSVELEEVGYFTVSLTARPIMDKKEIRSPSVSVKGVNFKPAKEFKKKLQPTLTRARYGFRKSDSLPIEKRKEILDNYLKEHSFIKRTKYSEITGLLKDLALKDLNNWVKEGHLKYEGRSSVKIYLPVKKEPGADQE